MTLQELIDRKQQLRYTDAYISEISGIPLPVVKRLLGGMSESPEPAVLEPTVPEPAVLLALERALAGEDHPQNVREPSSPLLSSYSNDRYDKEQSAYGFRADSEGRYPLLPFKQQGEYTAEDRDLLPDDVRTELIDGVLYDMASPSRIHQAILGELYIALRNCVATQERKCYVFQAPSDVWLFQDGKTILQPDLYIVCDNIMLGSDRQTSGGPSFVIEILSPSTRSKDIILKTYKYSQASVKEYWIVDPENKQIYTFRLDLHPDGSHQQNYSFTESIPIGISDGSCRVDFQKIYETLTASGLIPA